MSKYVFSALLIALVVPTSLSAQTQERAPSLDETLTWMSEFYATRGGARPDPADALVFDTKISRTEECGIATSFTAVESAKYVELVKLSDLSPRLSYVNNELVSRVHAETSSAAPLATQFSGNSGRARQLSRIGFFFSNAEDARRFGKALEHAIRLCGGKEPLF